MMITTSMQKDRKRPRHLGVSKAADFDRELTQVIETSVENVSGKVKEIVRTSMKGDLQKDR